MTAETSKRKILIVGGGAVGSVYGWRLQEGGAHVAMVCRSNFKVVKETGYTITSGKMDPVQFIPDAVYSNGEEAVAGNNVFDYVIVCTKCLPNLYDPAEVVAPYIISDKTVIVLVQNGIGIEEPVRVRFPNNPIISGIAYIDVDQTQSGIIRHGGTNFIVCGFYVKEGDDLNAYNKDNAHILEDIKNVFTAGNMGINVQDNVQEYRWSKIIWNGSFNPISVVAGCKDSKELIDFPPTRQLLLDAMAELYRVGEAVLGKKVPPVAGQDSPESVLKYTRDRDAPVYPSMMVDCINKRPMEHEVIVKNTIVAAKKCGVAVPILETVYALLVSVERSYCPPKN
ncbi:putative 2-dehydropantoate 2-reductase [Zancudomyces culisetae]|uniref:2-dehydropantoate 2-reductase n=1 Tax=Zancudomyces culisetae TaxID=1213189 RepID=A0A1R1PD53_ZANCU|nr:putative 2-dehydropantoate 2-reductase [Zancudomyces culisetae]OMH82695.1 putative 2-dehydropantoate 2-reductase [Zancudomyces culisetae]|eukprot:OMH78924.1 putative 2-dehydropantoate 2-reductase [Zancudomyces culisetae]